MNGQIVSINVGKPVTVDYRGRKIETGIFKSPVSEPLFLAELNFAGDEQADRVHHGGKDKAVCVYAFEHYPYWQENLNRTLSLGAFGENLTVKGLLETDVHIGDIFSLGEAVVQVSQPRQPCYKLALKYDCKDLPLRFQNSGYTGFYFRVLQEGWVKPDQPLKRLQRHPRQVTVAFANRIMHHEKANRQGVRKILEVDALSESWRKTLRKRLDGQDVNVKKRLEGKE